MRLPSPEQLWERHERYVLNIFIQALTKLRDENILPEEEVELNNILYVNVHQVWCDLPQNQKPVSFSLAANSENPPRIRDEIGQEWTRKKPDFRWTLSDPLEKNPRKATKDYAIECKRLRKKSNKGWDFIKEYVVSGIIRYISKEHSYGIGTKSGVMIGYIQDMSHDEMLRRVNKALAKAKKYKIPEIQFIQNLPKIDGIRNGNHTLSREEVDPNIFDLRHIWLDLTN
jgi:hypothetical protein